MTRRCFLTGLIVLVVLSWLIPGAFVTLYDPASPLPLEGSIPVGQRNPFFPHGYDVSGGTESWADGDTTHFKDGWRAQRGPLDRKAGTFRFSVRYAVEEGFRLRHLRLLVTSRAGWLHLEGDAHWTEVDDAMAGEDNAAQCEGIVPADSVAFAVRARIDGCEKPIGFSRSMNTAPTFLGRVYDRIAYLPIFAWLPDLR